MAQNFDEQFQDDMQFIVGGETFTMQWVRPEVLAQWEDEEAAETEEPVSAQAAVERMDQRVMSFLIPADRDRWKALRAREENAVPFSQLRTVVRWMVERQSERPTTAPSPSAGGRGRTGA